MGVKNGGKEESRYRIGEYAKSMGVTPDFLKHYEENGLLDVIQKSSGYRFYAFHQSPVILECMRLKSYGVTVREMRPLVHELSGPEAIARLDRHAEDLRRRIEHDTAVLAEHERFKAWLARREARKALARDGDAEGSDWEVREVEPYLYLPHSTGLSFIDDPRIQEILPKWVDWMPIVKSSLEISLSGSPDPSGEVAGLPFRWGLIAKESAARKHGIPANNAVQRIPEGRAFILYFSGPDGTDSKAVLDRRVRLVRERMASLGLRPRGAMQMVLVMRARMHASEGEHENFGYFIVPVEG